MTVHYQGHGVTVHAGDCLDVLAGMGDATVDSVVTDPPYGLEFMGKGWDRLGDDAVSKSWDTRGRRGDNTPERNPDDPGGRHGVAYKQQNPRCRTCGRAMQGRDTAKGFVVCHCETPQPYMPNTYPVRMQHWHEAWAAECLRVLKPGGHLLAFGGTRTSHRLASAIEDAGFEIRDSIVWLYGSGFPKSLDVGKAIDRLNGKPLQRLREFGAYVRAAREAAGFTQSYVNGAMGMPQGCGWWEGKGAGAKWALHLPSLETWRTLKTVIPTLGSDWDWFIEWAEAEREAVGSKPYTSPRAHMGASTFADGYDPTRTRLTDTAPATDAARTWDGWGTALKPAHEPIVVARKPLAGTVAANVLAHGTGALNIDGCRVDGVVPQVTQRGQRSSGGIMNATGGPRGTLSNPHAAGRWPANVVLSHADDCGDTVCAGGCPVATLDQQSGDLTSGDLKPYANSSAAEFTQVHVEHRTVSRPGDSGGASRFFYTTRKDERTAAASRASVAIFGFDVWDRQNHQGLPIDEPHDGFTYTAKASTAERVRLDGMSHATVKPLDLMRWLVRLVTPPGGTCLDPFAGSGTTAEAALLEGFACITIEREPDYLPLIVQRINRRRDPVAATRAAPDEPSLFDLLPDQIVAPPTNTRAGEASAERRYTSNGGTNFAMKPGRRRP